MNAPTPPTSLERAEKLQGMGCKRKRVEDVRFTPGPRQLCRRHQAAGHAARRFPSLQPRPRAHHEDRHVQGQGRARRRRGADRRGPQGRQSRLDADARRRRADGARRRQGAVPEPGNRLRRRHRPLYRRRRRRPRRGRIRRRCRSSSIRSRRWTRTRRSCARTSRTRRTARTARANTTTISSTGRSATRT